MNFDMRPKAGGESHKDSPFLGTQSAPIEDPVRPPQSITPPPLPSSAAGDKVLASWDALEHEPRELGSKAISIAIGLLIIIVAYAVYSNSLLMAIVFILIGMVAYLSLNQQEEPIRYAIMGRGIAVGREFYEYDDIVSFWILEHHPDFPKHLIIQTDGLLVSHVHIPLADQDVTAIRSFIAPFVPEQKYEPGLIDTIERIFHI